MILLLDCQNFRIITLICNNRHVFINVKNVAKQFKKVYLYTLLNLLLWTVFIVLFCICWSSEVRRRINISLDWNVMLTFGYTVIFILIYFCPVAYFFFIYCEIILLFFLDHNSIYPLYPYPELLMIPIQK